MELLARLHVLLPQGRSSDSARLRRLWPFLRHSLAAVRTAAVELFHSIIGMTSETGERPAPCPPLPLRSAHQVQAAGGSSQGSPLFQHYQKSLQ